MNTPENDHTVKTSKRVYVASSWRNPFQQEIVTLIRHHGHEVYDFKNPEPGNQGFHWSEIDERWKDWNAQAFSRALNHPVAEKGFALDWNAMEWADSAVLLLPCGRSAHIEAGYFVGAKKRLVIMLAEGEAELMYKMTKYVCTTPQEMLEALSI